MGFFRRETGKRGTPEYRQDPEVTAKCDRCGSELDTGHIVTDVAERVAGQIGWGAVGLFEPAAFDYGYRTAKEVRWLCPLCLEHMRGQIMGASDADER